MAKLILLRHGESLWNKRNLFTGWVDVPLSKKGIEEALEAGKRLSEIPIDIIITSSLIRAQMTAMLAMSVHHSGKSPVIQHAGEKKLAENSKIYSEETLSQIIPVIRSWELNERMYGELQGLDKAETAEKFGADQVKIWRRSYDVPPPKGESLEMTAARSIPYFKNTVIPLLKEGKNVLISAHGNSLRSIIMHLDHLSKDEVLHLELATGAALGYEFNDDTINKLGYL
jgi:2,3-bisphosphoglycerate-dependent phosphoglycerate mutase